MDLDGFGIFLKFLSKKIIFTLAKKLKKKKKKNRPKTLFGDFSK